MNISVKLAVIKKAFDFPLHPFLFAAFPIIFLYAYNIEETNISMTFKPLLVFLAGTAIFLFLAKMIFRSWLKAGLFVSLGVLIFFSHGHIHNLVGSLKYQVGGIELGTDDTLFGIWAILAVGAFFVLLRTKRDLKKLTGLLNFVSLILVLYLLITSLSHEIGRLFSYSEPSEKTNIQATGRGIGYKPDIYYIILDRYTSDKVLKDFYGFDNSEFTSALKIAGFYVVKDGIANYPRTLISLASSLNMTYLNSTDKFTDLVRNHDLGKFLKDQGYTYLHLGSWAGATNISPIADVNFKVSELYIDVDEFSLKLFQNTVLAPVIRKVFPQTAFFDFGAQHRNRALYQFARLKEIPRNYPGPKFVFAHILLPHDPYVFDRDCGQLQQRGGATIANYLAQLECTNKLVLEMVSDILKDSPKPPVIVIQGDEGSLDLTTLEPMKYPFSDGQSHKDADVRSMQERAGILNAFYLPGVGEGELLYQLITPVNSFRLILNKYFGTDFKLLQDKSYIFQESGNLYELDRYPYKFIDVTDRLER